MSDYEFEMTDLQVEEWLDHLNDEPYFCEDCGLHETCECDPLEDYYESLIDTYMEASLFGWDS